MIQLIELLSLRLHRMLRLRWLLISGSRLLRQRERLCWLHCGRIAVVLRGSLLSPTTAASTTANGLRHVKMIVVIVIHTEP